MTGKKQRAFIHELGHYVAKTITFNNYNIREAGGIFLTYVPQYDDYTGGTSAKILPGEDPNQPTVNFAEKIVDLEYGCMFQAYYQNTEFGDCFCEETFLGNNCNGVLDLNEWAGVTSSVKFGANQKLSEMQDAHFDTLRTENLLSDLCKLDVEDFIESETGNNTQIDMKKLSAVVQPMLEGLTPYFIDYLERVRGIISKT